MAREFEPTLVEYDEDAAATRVYRFDPASAPPGEWSAPDSEGRSAFRVLGKRLQWYRFKDGVQREDRERLEAFLRGLEPILEDRCLEIWIGKDAEGHFLRDYSLETNGPLAADLPDLTSAAFKRSFEALRAAVLEDW